MLKRVPMGFFDRWFKKDAAPDNRALEKSFRDLAQTDTAEIRRAFYDLLKQSTLILPTPHEQPGGPKVSDGSAQIGFIVSSDASGKTALLAFTSESALLAWRPAGSVYTALSAHDIFQLAVQKEIETIIFNPSGPAGGYLTRPEFSALAEGVSPGASVQNTSKETEWVISKPDPAPPEQLIALLRSQVRSTPGVRGLLVVTASIGAGPPHYVFGVELEAAAQADAVIPPLMQALQSHIEDGNYVDFVPLEDDALAAEIRARGLRVY